MESQIKTMKHYATDSNANKKSSEVELEEWIDGDYENQWIWLIGDSIHGNYRTEKAASQPGV
jgi:hypothetical protein